jgi:hypothetical protein
MHGSAPTDVDSSSLLQYTGGTYWDEHPNWHLEDSPGKTEDILPGLIAIVDQLVVKELKLADVGAGVGGVLVEVVKRLREARPQVQVDPTAIEVSPRAVEEARRRYPELKVQCKPLEASDGPFTVTMLIDVLEHLENPRAMLQAACGASQYLVVRQPLEENFATFRRNAYKAQRDKWSHIGYFNYHSFIDLALSTGWRPLHIELVAPWELKTNRDQSAPISKRLFVRANRLLASYIYGGFYLNGSFVRANCTTPLSR